MDGLYESYDRDDRLQRRSLYVNGAINGFDEIYFRKIPVTKTHIVNDMKNGIESLYDDYGVIVSEKNYKDDLLDGISTVYHSDGKKKASETLFSEGKAIKVLLSQDKTGKNKIIPPGNILVWKAGDSRYGKPVLIQISVDEKTERVTPHQVLGRYKSRIASGTVVQIIDLEKNQYDEAISCVYNHNTILYQKGQRAVPDRYDPDPNNDCSHGINVHLDIEDCYQWFKNPS